MNVRLVLEIKNVQQPEVVSFKLKKKLILSCASSHGTLEGQHRMFSFSLDTEI